MDISGLAWVPVHGTWARHTAPGMAGIDPQSVGERLAADGAQAILYRSAARARALCLCVFEPGLPGLTVPAPPVRVIAPPPPPRGLRT